MVEGSCFVSVVAVFVRTLVASKVQWIVRDVNLPANHSRVS